MYRYEADVITSDGTLNINAISTGAGDEVLAIFKDEMGTWRKTYDDVESFKNFIDSLHVKNNLKVAETFEKKWSR